MTSEYCAPVITPPNNISPEEFARLLAPQTLTSYYPSKNSDGVEVTPDLTPHCAGQDERGECPTVQLLLSLRKQGKLPTDFEVPTLLGGCLYAHSQP